jgi:hypothetical protein
MLAKTPGSGAVASVRLSAFGLANTDARQLFRLVNGLLAELGALKPLAVSRVDVAVDVQGFEPTPELMAGVVCPAKFRPIYPSVEEAETFQYGQGDVVVRVYNKVKEIAHSKKSWVKESWAFAGGYDKALPVWRIEVQLRRKALSELGIDHPAQVLDRPGALLDYGLCWANLRVPTGDSTKTRWPEHPDWARLREAVFDATPLQRKIRPAELISLDRTKTLLLGLAATAGAYFETDNYLDSLQRLSFALEAHMMENKIDFAALVEVRRRRILSEGV